MGAWIAWGTRVIQSVQAFGSPTWDRVFVAITFLGEEQFYLLLVPILYWCVDKTLAMHLSFVYLGSAYVNTTLKAIFMVPRPSAPAVRVVKPADGYSFPSGHAQIVSVGWFYLATRVKRAWFWVLAAILVLAVCLSRVYLGVHYPTDVIVGTLIGLALVWGYVAACGMSGGYIAQWPLAFKLMLACVVPLLLLALHSENDTVSAMSTLLGLAVGVVLEREKVRFRCAGSLRQRTLRFLVGVSLLLALYVGLKRVFPVGVAFRGLRYVLVGAWASLGAPWAFVKLRLAEQE